MKRETVRINITIPIEIKKISEKDAKNKEAKIIGDLPLFSYIIVKDTMDEALNNWLKLINAKLDYIISFLLKEKEGFHALPEKKVNFSEKGLHTTINYPLKVGTFVEIKLILELYQPVGFYLYGKVIRCDPKNSEYEIAVEFINIPPDIQDKISFYILNKERELIRKRYS